MLYGAEASNVHMAWMWAARGRLKNNYHYSKDVVHNNFPWLTLTNAQKPKIEKTAQAVLDVRTLYLGASLADLYDETTMPAELCKAHQQNDRSVIQAYGFSVKDMIESKCVAELMDVSGSYREKRQVIVLSLQYPYPLKWSLQGAAS